MGLTPQRIEHRVSFSQQQPCIRKPSRVFKGQKMSGRMGGNRVTQLGLVVHQVDVERNLLLVKGAVPGPKSGIVEIRSTD